MNTVCYQHENIQGLIIYGVINRLPGLKEFITALWKVRLTCIVCLHQRDEKSDLLFSFLAFLYR